MVRAFQVYKNILVAFFCTLLLYSNSQTPVKITGQFTGIKTDDIKYVIIKAAFVVNKSQYLQVNEFGSFSGIVETTETGIATLTFKNYTYEIVIGAEPELRINIDGIDGDSKRLNIHIEDSKENSAYKFTRILLNQRYRMYTYYENCILDSCLAKVRFEQEDYRHNRDSIKKVYPNTYATNVLCSFYDFQAPLTAKELPSTIKRELLNKTPWQQANAYSNRVIDKVARLYLEYAPDSGLALRQSVKTLLEKTSPGSSERDRLANILFTIFIDDEQEERLKEFLTVATDSPEVFADPVLKEKCRRYAKIIAGNQAPEIELPDSTGKYIRLSEVAKSNKYTLLFLWNPGCSHCIQSMPTIRSLYQKYKSKGLEIYGVSLSNVRPEWLKALQQNNCDWINVVTDEAHRQQPEEYFITYTPTLVLIDKNGIIVKRQLVVEKLEETLKQFFR